VTAIVASLKAAVVTKPPVRGAKKGKRRGKKEVFDAENANEQREAAVKPVDPNWGLFEPLRSTLEPVTSIFSPFVNSQVVIAVLATLLVYSWLFPSAGGRHAVGFTGRPERVAAYEELWRREESELWEWLEDRVGLDGLAVPGLGERQKVLQGRNMGKALKNERLRESEVDEAIRVTEERLGTFKEVVGKGKKS
jgi:hypothetical protein